MDSESNGEKESEVNVNVNVKYLQASLFPPQVTSSGSYFSNFFIKATQYVEEDDENKLKIKETLSFRDLFVSTKDVSFTLQAPRWPTECQVLEEKIEHINYIPPSLEAYYPVTGNECQPKPSGEECGVVVYQYQPISAVNYFSRSSVGGSSYLLSSNLCPEEDGLKFESRFESGNLARAIRITPNYYELHLRADLYTNRHMQWFYFRVGNTKKGFLYRFSITNCSKENSLYNEGMRPLMYSKKDSQLHCIGWRRCGQNISYFCNDNVTPEDPDQQMTYTLTFTVEFPHDDDEVYLAHCYPYTYSNLQDYLQELSSHPVKTNFCTVRLLCKTLAGNNVYFVTITSPAVPGGDSKKKRAVVITARVHPGETPSSWMVKGILDFLSGDSSPAKELRDKFIFKIVPMLNPDGVIVGNNRCSLSAKDLNRQYRTVMRDTYPSIWYTKLMVRRLLEECGVAMYCDLHAHSRKHNIFIYGCENRRGGDRRLQEQVFPLMLHKNTAEKFSFESCKFRIQKAKEGTGRIVMWMMGIANSYTMEASFAGSSLGNRNETHFNTLDYEQMGRSFCQTLLDFYDDDPRKEKLRTKIIDRLTKEGSNADEPTNIPLSDYSSDDGDTSSSSDEVGREEEETEIIVPTPPPPSPVLALKKPKAKSSPTRRVLSRSPCAARKPLPVNRKYDLELREYTQEEIDRPEYTEELRVKSICWVKPSKPQHALVVDLATHVRSVLSPREKSARVNFPDDENGKSFQKKSSTNKAVQSCCSVTTQCDATVDVGTSTSAIPFSSSFSTRCKSAVDDATSKFSTSNRKSNAIAITEATETTTNQYDNDVATSTSSTPFSPSFLTRCNSAIYDTIPKCSSSNHKRNPIDITEPTGTPTNQNDNNVATSTRSTPFSPSFSTQCNSAIDDATPKYYPIAITELTRTTTNQFDNYVATSTSSTPFSPSFSTQSNSAIYDATPKCYSPNRKGNPIAITEPTETTTNQYYNNNEISCKIPVAFLENKASQIFTVEDEATQSSHCDTTVLDASTLFTVQADLDVANPKISASNLIEQANQLTQYGTTVVDASTVFTSQDVVDIAPNPKISTTLNLMEQGTQLTNYDTTVPDETYCEISTRNPKKEEVILAITQYDVVPSRSSTPTSRRRSSLLNTSKYDTIIEVPTPKISKSNLIDSSTSQENTTVVLASPKIFTPNFTQKKQFIPPSKIQDDNAIVVQTCRSCVPKLKTENNETTTFATSKTSTPQFKTTITQCIVDVDVVVKTCRNCIPKHKNEPSQPCLATSKSSDTTEAICVTNIKTDSTQHCPLAKHEFKGIKSNNVDRASVNFKYPSFQTDHSEFSKDYEQKLICLRKLCKPQQVLVNKLTSSRSLCASSLINKNCEYANNRNDFGKKLQLEHVADLDQINLANDEQRETECTENKKLPNLLVKDYLQNRLDFIEFSSEYKEEPISWNKPSKVQYAKVQNAETPNKSSTSVDDLDLSDPLITEYNSECSDESSFENIESIIGISKSSQTRNIVIDSFKNPTLNGFRNGNKYSQMNQINDLEDNSQCTVL